MFGLGLQLGAVSLRQSADVALISKYGNPALLRDNNLSFLFEDDGGTIPASYNGVVGFAKNKKGGDYNFTQAVAGNKPTLKQGDSNYLAFNGASSRLQAANPFTGNAITIFLCGKWTTTPTSTEFCFSFGNSANATDFFGLYANSIGSYGVNGGGLFSSANFSMSGHNPTSKFLMTMQINGTSAYLRINGVQKITTTLAGAIDLTNSNIITIGGLGRSTVGLFADYEDSYMFAIPQALTTSEILYVEGDILNHCKL